MKKLIPLIGIVLLIVLARCTKPSQETTVKLLAEPKFRAEVIREIFNNKAYLSEFSEKMEENKLAPAIYKVNPTLIRMAWESEKMDSLIEADGTVTQKMLNRVMRRMDKDTVSVKIIFERLMENERFKNHVIRYHYGRQKPLEQKN